MTHVPAKYQLKAFNCPHPKCGAFAKQEWFDTATYQFGSYSQIAGLEIVLCAHCRAYSVWHNAKQLFPATKTAPPAHSEMPDTIKDDYAEAQSVFELSPRSSAALLRLCVQKLCVKLGQPGKNLNADIGALVAQGLPELIQQSLDIVRVIGNNQVHPGVLDISDDPQTATMLFELVNLIVDDRIAQPKKISGLFAKLPDAARKQIEERNAKAKAGAQGPATKP